MLSPVEQLRKMRAGECIYCGQTVYPSLMSSKAKRGGSPITLGALVSRTSATSVPQPRMQLDAVLVVNWQSFPLCVLVDSRADANFLDASSPKLVSPPNLS